MRDAVFIGTGFVAKYPTGGGAFWVPAQYLLGLRALGVEAYWLDLVWAATEAEAERARGWIAQFLAHADEIGLGDWVGAVLCMGSATDPAPPVREEHAGAPATNVWERARDGLLLNMANHVPAVLGSRFGRTVLFDIDPGQFQLWARQVDMGIGSHDAYVTIGQNLGAEDCPVPLGGVPWRRIWPAVHLPAWPRIDRRSGDRYTTVTQWWNDGWTVLGDEVIEGNKRASFLRVVGLPRRVPVQLELAANVHPGDTDDLMRLDQQGWHLADPAVVAGSPAAFRRYVQASRGEFGCAKPSYVRTRPGWISDRSVCYLASGRPCVVESTGAERHLPDSPALRFFSTEDEAVEALLAVERDYAATSRAARALAEEVFATRVVVPQLLEAAGLR
jgi:hypothetical protein